LLASLHTGRAAAISLDPSPLDPLDQHTGRAAAISMDPSPLDKAKRSSWCLPITLLTMQFCNKRNLGDLLTADKLCVYKDVQSLARDAFHNYGQRLYLIGKRQSQGSQRQKAIFMPANWFFDR
jgi:hypothetical protein